MPKPSRKGKSWDRQGDDCAYILRNLATTDGFSDWEGFKKDSAFAVFKQNYNKQNLKRNFDKTVQRYKEWLSNGGGGFYLSG